MEQAQASSSTHRSRSSEACESGLEVYSAGPQYISPIKDESTGLTWTRIDGSSTSQVGEKRILRLRKVTFWLLVALLASLAGLVATITLLAINSRRIAGIEAATNVTSSANASSPCTSSTSTPLCTNVTSTTLFNSPFISNCTSSGEYFYSDKSGLKYRKSCNTYMAGLGWNHLVVGQTPTFEMCISMCDSINQWNPIVRNMTLLVWNFGGDTGEPYGLCSCDALDLSSTTYGLLNSSKRDTALLYLD